MYETQRGIRNITFRELFVHNNSANQATL